MTRQRGRRRGASRSKRGATRRAFYDAYMASPAWWGFRRRWATWARRGGPITCRGCGQLWRLKTGDLHHATYARLGAESFTDLWPLCRGCHDLLHELLERPGWRRAGRVQAHRAALALLHQHAALRDVEPASSPSSRLPSSAQGESWGSRE
ncbi:hypothetical protein [Pseudactinotalea sp. HY158]|uniref:hypothetical protein n=1 Tax=Pseudactinotalea sp. HY158 TaxID=2654547 RepID=UPI00129C511E|nr:hypothetical protein [Pseudactinotalea sp. HY158]QGH70584.1 hypothetical protein GCE65_14610 [Pseudactinotalea sp. HY158]